MDPITMMRNALGKAEGGSGVPLDRAKYMESVKYWEKRAMVKWMNSWYDVYFKLEHILMNNKIQQTYK